MRTQRIDRQPNGWNENLKDPHDNDHVRVALLEFLEDLAQWSVIVHLRERNRVQFVIPYFNAHEIWADIMYHGRE